MYSHIAVASHATTAPVGPIAQTNLLTTKQRWQHRRRRRRCRCRRRRRQRVKPRTSRKRTRRNIIYAISDVMMTQTHMRCLRARARAHACPCLRSAESERDAVTERDGRWGRDEDERNTGAQWQRSIAHAPTPPDQRPGPSPISVMAHITSATRNVKLRD